MRFKTGKIILITLLLISSVNSHSIDTAEEEAYCIQLGFKKKTADFGECVIEFLGRINKQNRRFFNLEVDSSPIDKEGFISLKIKSSNELSSLLINGDEQGASKKGTYNIKKFIRTGLESKLTIVATDSNGNIETKIITTQRVNSTSINPDFFLKPEKIKPAKPQDAVAIIIGIQNYKRIAKADFANNDAQAFYDYAVRALGVSQDNIKLLIDSEADEVGIIQSMKNWLPLHVKSDKTKIYVFYSGHGLPSPDGKLLYLLPQGVDKDLLERTAINQQEIITSLQASKPKSVTMFIDSCYSGLSRTGETLLASARPISLKSKDIGYPPEFTVITASSNDQISSSSPELQHGIFSFYLMKGMEGDADINNDGQITAGEMQRYVSDKVSRQAMSMNRKQDTQLIGEPNKVLLTK
ncbi:Caspase domain containing protein [Oxalobacteraceae bacterium]